MYAHPIEILSFGQNIQNYPAPTLALLYGTLICIKSICANNWDFYVICSTLLNPSFIQNLGKKSSRQKWTHLMIILEKSPRNAIIWNLVPYNLWFRIFSENLTYSNNAPHYPLQSCTKMDRFLEASCRKGQKPKNSDT